MFAILAIIAGVIATLDHPIDDWSLPWMFPLAVTFIGASLAFDGHPRVWAPPWRRDVP